MAELGAADSRFIKEYVTVGDASLWTVRSGAGVPTVLAHGGPGLNDNLEGVARLIDDLACVYRYDQRGCDRSTLGTGPLTVDGAIEDLEALRLHFGCDRWVVGGHSWGATLALLYVLRYPRRSLGLIYIDGPGLDPDGARAGWDLRRSRLTAAEWEELETELALVEDADAAVKARAQTRTAHLFWTSDFADRRRVPDLHIDPLYTVNRDPVIYRAVSEDLRRVLSQPSLRTELRECEVPALIVRGAEDPIPAHLSIELSELLPNAHYFALQDVGHTPWLELPDRVTTVLRSFLRDGICRGSSFPGAGRHATYGNSHTETWHAADLD